MIESQLYFEKICPFGDSDREIVINLVHDLRQPLGSIEAIACYLEMRLSPEQNEVLEYVLKLQDLVEEANKILSLAVVGRTKISAATA